jgi:HK97 gp10 family phage protein
MSAVGIFGIQALVSNLRKAREAADKAIEREVHRARLAVETKAKNLIAKGPKTGWMYMRQFDGKWMVISKLGMMGNPEVVAVYRAEGKENMSEFHQASAPGEPPANDTGELGRTIKSTMEVLKPGVAAAVVWADAPYAKYLEFGTKRMEPRPFMTPAVEFHRAKYPQALGAAVVESIDKAVSK